MTIAWIGPLVSAGVAIAQALEGARATASAEEQAEIDRALATIRGTDTRVTARHDADLAVRLTRGGVAVPVRLPSLPDAVRVRAALASRLPTATPVELDAIVRDVMAVRPTEPPPSPYEPEPDDGA